MKKKKKEKKTLGSLSIVFLYFKISPFVLEATLKKKKK